MACAGSDMPQALGCRGSLLTEAHVERSTAVSDALELTALLERDELSAEHVGEQLSLGAANYG